MIALLLTLAIANQETPAIHFVESIPTSTGTRFLTLTEDDLRKLEREALGVAERCVIKLHHCQGDLEDERKAVARAETAWRDSPAPAADAQPSLPTWLWIAIVAAAGAAGVAGCTALHCGR